MKSGSRILAAVLLLTLGLQARAVLAAPAAIPVQGVLSDAAGAPISGVRSLTFRLYTSSSASVGSEVFVEERSVTLTAGFFAVYVGQERSLPLSLFRDHPTLFLGVTVEGDPSELSPRFAIGTAPYAAYAEHAGDAATLEGLSSGDFALSTHSHSFQSLTDVPFDLLDGDSDVIGKLSCPVGWVAVSISSGWYCGSITDANIDSSANISPTKISGTAWTKTNDGADSELDADKLDGLDSTAYLITKSRVYTRNLRSTSSAPRSHAVWSISCSGANDVGLNCGCGGYDQNNDPHPGARVTALRLEKYDGEFDTCICGLANDSDGSIAPWVTIQCLRGNP